MILALILARLAVRPWTAEAIRDRLGAPDHGRTVDPRRGLPMTGDIRQTVISGVPYVVTSVADGTPATLDAFLDDAEFTIALKDEHHLVRGHGRGLDDKVVFYEKDHIGGKDVRVWHVTVDDSGTVKAEAVAAF
jgi:hypothetical protein